MKLYQSIALLGLAVFGLASCSEEPDFRAYDPAAETTEEQVTFAQAELSYKLVPTDEVPSQIPVLVRRANSADSLKVKLNATSSDASIINCTADSVEFEAGSLVDTLWVDFDADNYVIGEEYTLDLELAVDSGVSAVSAAGLGETTVTVFVDYTWVPAGSCIFDAADWVSTEEVVKARVKIEHAKEVDGYYRLVDYFYALEPNYSEKGYYLGFMLDEDYNLVRAISGSYVGEEDSSGTPMWFYWNPNQFPQYCSVETNGNEYKINGVLAAESSLKYTVNFTFVWDEGWPGE